MANKLYVNEYESTSRIVSAGKISSAGKFSLGSHNNKESVGFTLYLRAKEASDVMDALVSVTMYQGNVLELPVPVGDWSPCLFKEVNITSDILAQYDVYWGAGEYVENK